MAKYNLTASQKDALKNLVRFVGPDSTDTLIWQNGNILINKGPASYATPVQLRLPDLVLFEKLELLSTHQSGQDRVTFSFNQKALDAVASDFKEEDEPATPSPSQRVPLGITESLAKFRQAHPDPRKCCFVMMKFGSTLAHSTIIDTLRTELRRYGIEALRADEKEYHDTLYDNVMTYIYGCGFGIAVFERLLSDDFNPNVSLEVGYMLALGKPVCFMKDKTLPTLHTDLVGKLYRSFDPQGIKTSMPAELQKWLDDKGLLH